MSNIGIHQNFLAFKPDIVDKDGPGWSVKRVTEAIAVELTN
jgi:hypothetical protein